MKEMIIDLIKEKGPLSYGEILSYINCGNDELAKEIFNMEDIDIIKIGKLYNLIDGVNFIRGTIVIRNDNPYLKTNADSLYVAKKYLGNAFDKDIVIATVHTDYYGRKEARVYKVVSHSNLELVAKMTKRVYRNEKIFKVVDPNSNYEFISVKQDKLNGAHPKDICILEIKYKGEEMIASVKKIIGHESDIGSDVLALVASAKVPYIFNDNIYEEVNKINNEVLKEEFEKEFADDYRIKDDVASSAINTWLFNLDTINKVLKELMKKGLKVEGGDVLGKTIVFAKNSLHAKAIVDRFNKLFPEYGGEFIKQIDYSINYCDTLIDDFSTREKMPQIAVSVDMLDTGIDIPEILNLVFFKKVRSYAKFWQMIGRGTRLCPNLLGEGIDKERFLIFDFCNNFEYFRVNKNGSDNGIQETLSEKIYNTKAMICRELQSPIFVKQDVYVDYRAELVKGLHEAVVELHDDSFMVKRHLRYVETYRCLSNWNRLGTVEITDIKEHVSPLIKPKKENELARRFDYLIYSIGLGVLQSKNVQKPVNIVVQTAEILLATKSKVPQVAAQKAVLEKVVAPDFWQNVNVLELDIVRVAMRELLQYIDKVATKIYYVNFTDEITTNVEGTPIYDSHDLKDYRKKVEFYLKEHSDNLSVYKLRNNKKCSKL